jgi:hypothetical protein
MQRKEIGCWDFILWAVLAGYVTLTVSLSGWLADLLGVPAAVLAFPVAVGPILIPFRREWRNSYYLVVPVAVAVLLVLASGTAPWLSRAFVALCALAAWFVLHGIAMWKRHPDGPEKQSSAQDGGAREG